MTDASPLVWIDNQSSRELTRDCVMLEIEEADDALPVARAHFVGDHHMNVGMALRVTSRVVSRQRTTFDGVISAVEYAFDESAAPMIVVSAERTSHSRRRRTGASLTLVRGDELLSARVMIAKTRPFVTVEGIVSGWPSIAVSSVLRLEHIGVPFSGDGYHVTRIGHTFDLDLGLRSTFVAQRPF